MSEEFLGDRKKALEEQFFRKQNEAQLAKLRTQQQAAAQKAELAHACGISDEAVLSQLLALGIQPETVVALGLVPLVQVAWVDGELSESERKAVLSAATSVAGLSPGSAPFDLLQSWLSTRPKPALFEAWSAYTRALCESLGENERHQLRDEILGRARRVAEAAGGILGLGSKISPSEAQLLAELAKVFA